MTRDERNRKISELRETLGKIEVKGNLSFSSVGFFAVKDWHADANWPTLLREILRSEYGVSHLCAGGWDGKQWSTVVIQLAARSRHEDCIEYPDIAEAVTEAWLQWKQPALGKGAG